MTSKKNHPPKRRRTNREGRLARAPHWLATFSGTNVVRGYAKWFAVDRLCALKELQLLGLEFSAAEIEMVHAQERQRRESIQQRKAISAEKWASLKDAIGFEEGYFEEETSFVEFDPDSDQLPF